jgi:hypothetical protein
MFVVEMSLPVQVLDEKLSLTQLPGLILPKKNSFTKSHEFVTVNLQKMRQNRKKLMI